MLSRENCRRFDLETDGLLDEVTTIHVMVITDMTTGERRVYRHNDHENTIPEGIAWLTEPGVTVVGQNSLAYDCMVLHKLHGVVIPWRQQLDTLVLSRLTWLELKKTDMNRRKKLAGRDFPGHLTGRHSLEAWGHRFGEHKGDYKGDPLLLQTLLDQGMDPEDARKETYSRRWETWNQAMEDYCVQDDVVTGRLCEAIVKKNPSLEAVAIEMQVAHILDRQQRYGFLFDEAAAVKLYTTLVQRKLELEGPLKEAFKPRYLPDGPGRGKFTPSRDNKGRGYVGGAPLTKVKLTEFNPTSRDHVAMWLRRDLGWVPTEFTADGKPKVDDDVISKLPYPDAAPLKEYFMLSKRIGQIAEGKQAWLKKVGKDKRMHGRVNQLGAVTRRMTHDGPNMGQVPSAKSPYGPECRACFIVPKGKKLVGIDAEALELRDLAGYMAIYDGGAYIETVLRGDKALGTDIHSVNARALGLDPKKVYFDGETGRDIAKTWFYAFIYGSGDENLGYITTRKHGPPAAKAGKEARASFMRNLPAMEKLIKNVKERARGRGFLIGLDKHPLPVRSQHAALNTLLQSAGALQMKKALCIFDDSMQEAGLIPGVNYEFVANVHDEWQLEVDDDKAELVRDLGIEAIRLAGVYFNFRCPLAGAGEIGNSWAETH